ncbi:LPS-assembly protein LptD [Vineibacter terrae]|uniref:LPS-assembly protein LptD n=1 Tax=Vineibacter terrae TaxID=2586908 RepID=UPI002E33D764|nr:LPS assembly protein LptD [Vineibacter terrae]HEX2891272.1 LPS assembly protein LptD [Vineibacter terrae]
MTALRTLILLVVGLAFFETVPASAQLRPDRKPDRTDPDRVRQQPVVPSREKPSTEQPVLVQANDVAYDRATDVVTASGNVEMSQNDRILQADRVVYDRKRDIMTAIGHVRIVEPTGEVIYADQMQVTGDLKEGAARDIRARLANDARLAGNSGQFTEGKITEVKKAVYSPCDPCKDDPTRAPLWQVKAARVVHDKEKKDIYFYDATLEFFGVPVAWTPYFSHPDPSVKRRSGILTPSFEHSGQLGYGMTLPYYGVIDDTADITLSPRFLTRRGLVMSGDIRKRFDEGDIQFKGSITRDWFHDREGAEVRGHVFGTSQFNLDENWRAGMQLQRATDKTYLRYYDIDSSSFLTSKAWVETFNRRSYGSIFAYGFQEMRSNVSQRQAPYVLPVASYNFVGEQMPFGGHFIADTNMRYLFRDEGADSTRLMARVGYDFTHVTRDGHVFNVLATVRGDIYDVHDAVDPENTANRFTGVKARIFPQISADWRYPLMRRAGERSYFTVEPIVGFVAAPRMGRQWKIPNEDAVDQVFDETNLFSPNRTTGDDRLEGGQRINYGFKVGLNDAGGGSSWLFVGQSFRFQRDTSYPSGSGLRSGLSDLIGALSISPGRYWDVFGRIRVDKDNPTRVRQVDALVSAGPREFRGFLGYIKVQDNLQPTASLGNRSEGRIGVIVRPHENWIVTAWGSRDLQAGATREIQGKVEYEDECFLIGLRVTRRYFTDKEIKPDTRIGFQIRLKPTTDTTY